MVLSELVSTGELIEVRCHQCRARTRLDSALFLVRKGDVELGSLSEHLLCAQCGSTDIEISAIQPERV